MSLTREEVERIENTLQRNLSDFEIHGGMVRYWASIIDAKTLLREYRTAMDERDALAAEGRALREALEVIRPIVYEYQGLAFRLTASSIINHAVATTPLVSAEVERVRRLEAVLEAAEEYRDAEQVQMLNEFKYDEPKYERQQRAKAALDAAIAVYREGERPGGEDRETDGLA